VLNIVCLCQTREQWSALPEWATASFGLTSYVVPHRMRRCVSPSPPRMSDSVHSGGTVLRTASPFLVAVFAALLPHTPLGAQETGTTVTLTVSPSFVNFDGFGGSFGAVVARLSVSRDFTRITGAEISLSRSPARWRPASRAARSDPRVSLAPLPASSRSADVALCVCR
jgi:hypothetical protein